MIMQRLLGRSCRFASTSTLHASTASKELALPIAFLTCPGWSGHRAAIWSKWIEKANAHGYSCLSIEVDHATNTLDQLEQELSNQLRQSSSPFPPLLCAYALDTLVAQTYVSSHPLSGLALVDPPLTLQHAQETKASLPLDGVSEFDYEPFFPLAILAPRIRAEKLETHRLRQEYGDEVELLVTPDESPISEDGFNRLKDWMDANGL